MQENEQGITIVGTTVTWTAGGGQHISVEVLGYGSYRVSVDGTALGESQMRGLPNDKAFDAARRAGVVSILSDKVAVTASRADALKTLDAQMTAQHEARLAGRNAILNAEAALADTEYRLTRNGYGQTGANGAAVERAQAALHAAVVAHPADWADLQAERAMAQAEKQTELDASFVRRGLD